MEVKLIWTSTNRRRINVEWSIRKCWGAWIVEWYHTWLWTSVCCIMPWAMSSSLGDDKLFFRTKHTIYVFFMIVVGFLIWYSYLSVTFVMWSVKQEIKNKQNLFLKKLKVSAFSREHLVKEKINLYLITRHQCERGLWYVGKPTVGPLTS